MIPVPKQRYVLDITNRDLSLKPTNLVPHIKSLSYRHEEQGTYLFYFTYFNVSSNGIVH